MYKLSVIEHLLLTKFSISSLNREAHDTPLADWLNCSALLTQEATVSCPGSAYVAATPKQNINALLFKHNFGVVIIIPSKTNITLKTLCDVTHLVLDKYS
jgi:hypothetical protein